MGESFFKRGSVSGIFLRLLRDESGQSITEYILLLSAVIAGTTLLSRGILGAMNRGVLGIGAQLEKDLKTGRMNVGIWSK